ncbi:MAG: hypothetical protein LYZ70_07180 [Nitrososphaerales archaeon]|nr:hypothetical protein [Nitrososphaerales archaeon]
MKYIPSPRRFRLTLVYAIIVLLLALGVGASLYTPSTYQGAAIASSVLLAFGTFAVVEYRWLKEFAYDEKGVYRWNKLMFPWAKARKISLGFSESTGSVTLVARPSLAALLSGPLVDRETWVAYGISMVFSLDDGSSVSIPSNLDRMTDEGMIENIHEVAKAANPSIEIE